jgi:hypothetical protein
MSRFVELGHLQKDGEETSARFADHLGQLPLASVAGLWGIVIDAPVPPRAIAAPAGGAVEDKAVLIRTGWDSRWGTQRANEVRLARAQLKREVAGRPDRACTGARRPAELRADDEGA